MDYLAFVSCENIQMGYEMISYFYYFNEIFSSIYTIEMKDQNKDNHWPASSL